MRTLFRSVPWDEVDYWALDLELSGLNRRTDQILSVGMVPIRGGSVQWGDHYYSLVRPLSWENLDGEAIGVHHILPEELEEAPQLDEVISEVEMRLQHREALLVHHAPLDIGFLRAAFRDQGRHWPKPPIVDTRILVSRYESRQRRLRPYLAPIPRGLAELRTVFDLPPFDPHHALWDALATAELFLVLRTRLEAKTLRQLRSG